MKIVFAMQSPGYIRNYESVLRLMAARGHDVHLSFEKAAKYADLLALTGTIEGPGSLTKSVVPKRRDEWARTATALRTTRDYIRYLDQRFRHAQGLRRRIEKKLPHSAMRLTKLPTLPSPVVRGSDWVLSACEAAIPSFTPIEEYLRAHQADLLLITPLITIASAQTDVIKAARTIGLRSALCVGSWDHLTSKGLIRIVPDHVIVWNEAQRREVAELHGVRDERVVITGAQLFDEWFDREASIDAITFKARVGLDPTKPYVVFSGSTFSITPPEREIEFVESWIDAIRRAGDPCVRDLGVLIRPHPYNAAHWDHVDLTRYTNVALWRHTNVAAGSDAEEKALYFKDAGKAAYFDSFRHSTAVVGINSSSLIEASIAGAPVYTVTLRDFAETQHGTLHFRYLLPENGGPLHVAKTLEAHVRQLREAMYDPGMARLLNRPFVRSFIRPHGLGDPATPIFVDAVERLAALGPVRRSRPPAWAWLARRAMRAALDAKR